ncbi:MAG: rhomboid family intramembrane serine protease [Bacteroidota bacterium]
MNETSAVGTILLLLVAMTTYKGFRDTKYFQDNLFNIDAILIGKEYKRLLSSGFLHTGWWHFGFNMIALTSFSWSLELLFGVWKFLFIYFTSLIGGNLLALFIHRNHGDYSAVGASGAISGVILSSILLFPSVPIHFIFMPEELGIPGWLFGLLFIIISIFGIKKQVGNIGHEAHLGGALTGAVITLFFIPFSMIKWWVVFALVLPILIFLYLIIKNPNMMLIDNYWGEEINSIKNFKKEKNKPVDLKKDRQAELNLLLDKIGKSGLDSLSKEEKRRLDELTNEI